MRTTSGRGEPVALVDVAETSPILSFSPVIWRSVRQMRKVGLKLPILRAAPFSRCAEWGLVLHLTGGRDVRQQGVEVPTCRWFALRAS